MRMMVRVREPRGLGSREVLVEWSLLVLGMLYALRFAVREYGRKIVTWSDAFGKPSV